MMIDFARKKREERDREKKKKKVAQLAHMPFSCVGG